MSTAAAAGPVQALATGVRERSGAHAAATGGAAGSRRDPVPWLFVLLLAALLAADDSLVLTSLRGAIGAISKSQEPFASWLLASALLLPVLVVAVVALLARAHRRFGPELRRPRPVLVTALAIALASSVLGTAAVAATSAYDYRLQAEQLRVAQAVHAHGSTAAPHEHDVTACVASCPARRATLAVHVRGVEGAALVLLGTNVLLVAWAVALRGGRLDAAPRRRPAAQPA